jgi:hypothetical protein
MRKRSSNPDDNLIRVVPRATLFGGSSALRLLCTVLLVYLVLTAFAKYFCYRVIFQPPRPRYTITNAITRLPTADGAQIAVSFLPGSSNGFTLLYSHGNAEDLDCIMPRLHAFGRLGFGVCAYDYRGYGSSTGKPTEANAYADASRVYDFLTNACGVPPHRIIAYGRSLGGAMAAHVAARHETAGLILESAFVSAFRVVTWIPIIPGDKFHTLDDLRHVRCPVLIMHGKRDGIVPFWHGRRLAAYAPEPKCTLWVPAAGHNNLAAVAGDTYDNALRAFARLIAHTQTTMSACTAPTPPQCARRE